MRTRKEIKIRLLSILILFIVFVFSFSSSQLNTAIAISKPVVSLSDYRPNQLGVRYTISFSTSNGPGSTIQIMFLKQSGTDWVPNSAVINPSISPSQITIRADSVNYNPEGIPVKDGPGGALLLLVPEVAQSAKNFTVIISESSQFGNGGPGTYRIRVTVASETSTPADSDSYGISNPQLQSVSVSVTPSYAGKNGKYEITAKTNIYDTSSLNGGLDQIRIQFPTGTAVPATINANTISIKYGSIEKFVNTSTITSGNAVTFTIPSGISVPANGIFTVVFYENAGIINPINPGDYKLSIATLDSSGAIKDDITDSNTYSITATSLSNVSVVIEPSQVAANSKFTISFRTSSSGGLTGGVGEVHVKFRDNSTFYIPPSISPSQVSINGSAPSNIQVIGKEIKIVISQSIQPGDNVTLVLQAGAGIINPTETGSYKISLWTSSDPTSVDTPSFTITQSSVINVKVTVTPQINGMQAAYIIVFQTGSMGTLNAGDSIQIKFPQGTYVPNNISPDKVKVNNQNASSVSVSNTIVSITLSNNVPASYSVAVQFALDAGIKNPTIPQSYKILIHTSKEANDVESSPYDIIKGVTTFLNVSPSVPDGKNGFYRTAPTIEIKGDAPQGLTYAIYFKWDDASTFEKYSSSIKAPEGEHTLSYYAVDSFNNKEDAHTQTFRVDTQKPPINITSPALNQTFYDKNILITGTTEPGVSLYVSTGSTNSQVLVDKDGKFQYNFTFISEGNAAIEFTAEDSAGNSSSVDLSLRYVFQRRVMLIVGTNTAYINGDEVALSEAPFIYKGRVLVPIRFISEVFGAQVEWDNIFKIVTINLNSQILRLQVGNLTADVKGKAITLDVAPLVKNNTTFVPIRFISEAFGSSVEWDAVHGIVIITYPQK